MNSTMPQVLDSGLDEQLASLLRKGADIQSIRQLLERYRDRGFGAQAVYNYLALLRHDASEELEDRILEAMDIASGYCSPGCRVWEVAP
ncbi:hypothetical protein Q7O56_01175 [Pseudomonas protegens]|uniref:hypothetical protein n=1 Tax=Pseudomonas TaxID=286 RepID=UPI0021CCED5E|nr:MULTISPECIES: hypothetical protein [Pseudomonas]MDP9507634.1 hypothetical protein [Pseudomonas protegens]